MRRAGTHGYSAQTGVALAIVVWFLAAMSLMVAGIVFQGRVDVQLAQLHISKAKATASGDGAIQLMMASLNGGTRQGDGNSTAWLQEFDIGEQLVSVQLVPVKGLIDLKQAPKTVLAQLFFIPGEGDLRSAQLLADSVIKWRVLASQRGERDGQVARFSAVEDLLRVEGITRTHLDRVADVVYVGKGGAVMPDWRFAPAALLKMVSESNRKAASVLAGRAELGLDEKTLQGSSGRSKKQKLTAGDVFRVDAVVSLGGQKWVRRRFVSMAPSEHGRLPWQYFRTEPARVLSDG
jgi:hypothetical protein